MTAIQPKSRPKDTVLAGLAIVSAFISAIPPPITKKRSVKIHAPKKNIFADLLSANNSFRQFYEFPGVPTFTTLIHSISGDDAQGLRSKRVAAFVAKFIDQQGPEVRAMADPRAASMIHELFPGLAPPVTNSAGEAISFATHALTVLGFKGDMSAVKNGSKVLEQTLAVLLALANTAEPSLSQMMLANIMIDYAWCLPFEAWKLAMDRVGLSLQKLMHAVQSLAAHDSFPLKNLGPFLLEFAAHRFGRDWVDYISNDLDGFLSLVFTPWPLYLNLNKDRAVGMLVLAHSFDDTFAHRVIASPSFALVLCPEICKTSKSIAHLSAFLCCIGPDATLAAYLRSVPDFKSALFRASFDTAALPCAKLLDFHFPELDRTYDMIQQLQVLTDEDEWPDSVTPFHELLRAIPKQVMSIGDPITNIRRFHDDGHLLALISRFTGMYPVPATSTLLSPLLSVIGDLTPDVAPIYLLAVLVHTLGYTQRSLDSACTDLRRIMATLHCGAAPNNADLKGVVTKLDCVAAFTAVVGLDPRARRLVEEIPECCASLEGIADAMDELALLFVTDDQGDVFDMANGSNMCLALGQRLGKTTSNKTRMRDKYLELAKAPAETNFVLNALLAVVLTGHLLKCFDKYRPRMIKALVPLLVSISSYPCGPQNGHLLQLLLSLDANARADLRDVFEYASAQYFHFDDLRDGVPNWQTVPLHEAASIGIHRIARDSDAMSPVQWTESSCPGLVYFGVYGNRIINHSFAMVVSRASHGVTGRGKIGFWIRGDVGHFVTPGFSTRNFDITRYHAGGRRGRAHGNNKECLLMDFSNSSPFPELMPTTSPDLGWTAVLLDLDHGALSVCRQGTVAVPVERDIDASKVWYPTAHTPPYAYAETDFVRPLPHGYLSFAEAMASADPSTAPTIVTAATGAPSKRLTAPPSPIAYRPPANHYLFSTKHGATINQLPKEWTTSKSKYFEARFTPASPVVGLGIQRGGMHLMWVATCGVEMLVSFSAGTDARDTLEASVAWTELVPAVLQLAARGKLKLANEMTETVWIRWKQSGGNTWTPAVVSTCPADPQLEVSAAWMGVHAVAVSTDIASILDSPSFPAPPTTTEPMTLGFAFGAAATEEKDDDDDQLSAETNLPICASGTVEVAVVRRTTPGETGAKKTCAVSRPIIGYLAPGPRLAARYTVPVLIGGGQDSVVAFSGDAAEWPLAIDLTKYIGS
ncbi:hypothetical protein BC828DRAFT_381514 [Blastocladiella britannica]|nr:hypothetical protein BC828DRAFT_381514 [Blastocladiella britannica]